MIGIFLVIVRAHEPERLVVGFALQLLVVAVIGWVDVRDSTNDNKRFRVEHTNRTHG